MNVNGKDSVKIKSMKFEVCQYIYPNKLSFNQHQKIIKIIGNGWRLPTAFEFLIIDILNRDRYIPKLENEYSRYQKVVKVDLIGSELFLINNDGETGTLSYSDFMVNFVKDTQTYFTTVVNKTKETVN